MFLPKIKIKLPPKFTLGDLFRLPTGEPYSGYYFEDYKGNAYAGKSPAESTTQLIPIKREETVEDLPLVSSAIKPKVEDYDKGFFKRFYLKDSRNGKIVETTEKIYNSELEKLFIKGTTIDWVIQKPAKDLLIEGSLYQGAISRNKFKVQQAEQQLRGIADYITQYDEFVEVESTMEGYSFEELPYNQKVTAIDLLPSNIQKPKKPIPIKPKKVVKQSTAVIEEIDNQPIKAKPKPFTTLTNPGGGDGDRTFYYDESGELNQSEKLL